ncbi:cytochrome c oxidase assembly protein [Deinococcus aquiradiocola]|uniref:Cytochrome c oxidase assembly protein n=1 Tax=Deinococcus aquiradiocola TaxID=393059 RepID=A0A917PG93_9DEIO|nr:cytochrome c oxidase assembly protein [Deinococcus aquiradiocola]GGJ75934.1 hypothetical protein GCM10008939_20180 [Deinococcus aquiradiocola]
MIRPLPLAGAVLAALGSAALGAASLRGGDWPFSEHMAAHLLLSLAAAPLAVLAVPGWRPRPDGVLAVLLCAAVLLGLHQPHVMTRLMTPAGHALEAALYLLSALPLWLRAAQGGAGAAGALLLQMAVCAGLGAALTFSAGVYPARADDTALGGVLMWVVGGSVVMLAALATLISHLKTPEVPHEVTP